LFPRRPAAKKTSFTSTGGLSFLATQTLRRRLGQDLNRQCYCAGVESSSSSSWRRDFSRGAENSRNSAVCDPFFAPSLLHLLLQLGCSRSSSSRLLIYNVFRSKLTACLCDLARQFKTTIVESPRDLPYGDIKLHTFAHFHWLNPKQ
jgi:hypothetical protein